jgi:hypothetical protein
MALVWVEPLDQYGAGLSQTLLGQSGYSTVKGVTCTGRTGLYGIEFNWNFGGQAGWLIRPLNTPTNKLGMGYAIKPVGGQMNGNTWTGGGAIWQSTGGTTEMTVCAMADGSVGVFDRTNTLKGQTAPNMLIPNSYVWVEAVAIQNTGGVNTGYAEVRVNGIQKLVINNINLPNAFAFHGLGGAGSGNQNCDFDDWITWDGSGTANNTFMGDRRLILDMPTSNAATQNFTFTGGATAWQSCNVIPPVDTTYIEGLNPGDVSDFNKAAIGVNSTDIAALVVMGRVFKSDAGVGSFRIGVNSSANILNSAETFPGITAAYYYFVVEKDPNGNIPWTRAAVDAALVRATRVQ